MSCAQTVWQSFLTWGWMWKLFEDLPITPQPFLWMIREPGMENSSRERIAIPATIYWALIKRQVWLNPHNSQRRVLLCPSLARWGNGGTWSEAHRFSVEELVSNPNFCDSVRGCPGGSDGKEFACNAGDLGSIPRSGRSLGEGHGYPLQYSCLENPMDRGAWWATLHGVATSWTQLSN